MSVISINYTMPDDPSVEPLIYVDFNGTAFTFPLSGAITLSGYLSETIKKAQAEQHRRFAQAAGEHKEVQDGP